MDATVPQRGGFRDGRVHGVFGFVNTLIASIAPLASRMKKVVATAQAATAIAAAM